jgi:hypothetical protein
VRWWWFKVAKKKKRSMSSNQKLFPLGSWLGTIDDLTQENPRRLRLLEALENARNTAVLVEMDRLYRVSTQTDMNTYQNDYLFMRRYKK